MYSNCIKNKTSSSLTGILVINLAAQLPTPAQGSVLIESNRLIGLHINVVYIVKSGLSALFFSFYSLLVGI